jgi:hypothetical protein
VRPVIDRAKREHHRTPGLGEARPPNPFNLSADGRGKVACAELP